MIYICQFFEGQVVYTGSIRWIIWQKISFLSSNLEKPSLIHWKKISYIFFLFFLRLERKRYLGILSIDQVDILFIIFLLEFFEVERFFKTNRKVNYTLGKEIGRSQIISNTFQPRFKYCFNKSWPIRRQFFMMEFYDIYIKVFNTSTKTFFISKCQSLGSIEVT